VLFTVDDISTKCIAIVSRDEGCARSPTGCALAAPPPIDGNTIVADTRLENNPDLARREAASAASACWVAHGVSVAIGLLVAHTFSSNVSKAL
jgi:hypothetical protein